MRCSECGSQLQSAIDSKRRYLKCPGCLSEFIIKNNILIKYERKLNKKNKK